MKFKIMCRPQYNLWIKNISKLLVIGILLNSIPLDSFAGTLSPDTRYETFEGDNITISDILEEDNIDIEIEGNTLVNHSHTKSFTANSTPSYNRSPMLEPGKTYTFSCNISDIKNGPFEGAVLRITFEDGSFITPLDITYENGYYKKVFTIPSNKEISHYYIGWIRNYVEGQSAKLDNLMILEGDWTDKKMPDYFEGMKSVGELEDNSKMEILLQNKNLFNYEEYYKHFPATRTDDETILSHKGDLKGGNHNLYFSSPMKIDLKPNTTYTLCVFNLPDSGQVLNGEGCLSTKRSELGIRVPIGEIGYKVFETNSTNYKDGVSFKFNTSTEGEKAKYKVMIVEGDVRPANYTPYNLDKKEIVLKEPLRALSENNKDKIVKKNGEWYVERVCGEVLLNGNERWVIYPKIKEKTVLFYSLFDAENTGDNNKSVTGEIISDKFNHLDTHWENRGDDIEGAYTAFDGNICISIEKSKLSAVNEVGFREWLKNNPVKIVYKLSKPIYEPLSFDSLKLYMDTTSVSINSTVPANLKTIIDRTLNRATEYIEQAKVNPTAENLSKARYWSNLLKESVKKDQLQEQLSQVFSSDVTLDRKTATSNLDVYVKSENMLSLSLNTNSITFDGYSGTEDMEILGAVNISINSSLPYSLNAYMPNEITNNDKSEILPIDILNIKESGETAYQTFVNTADKIILKDNCNNGNDLIHNIDLKLASNLAHKADVYKTVIKFEAEQK